MNVDDALMEAREWMDRYYTEAAEHLRTKAWYALVQGASAERRSELLNEIAALWSEHVSSSSDRGYAASSRALDVLCTAFDESNTLEWIFAQMQRSELHVHWDLALSRLVPEGAQWVRDHSTYIADGRIQQIDIAALKAHWLQWGREHGFVTAP